MKILTYILIIITATVLRTEDKSGEVYTNITDKISREYLQEHIEILASDKFEGRASGTRGEMMAANYISSQLNDFGLDTRLQNVPMHGFKPLNTSKLCVYIEDKCINLDMFDDYIVYRAGASLYLPKPLEMVFVGYGITAPEFNYDDYYNFDVSGKIVVYIGGEPDSDNDRYFNGDAPTVYSSPDAKQKIALSHGAFGSIYLPSPDELYPGYWDELVSELSFEYITLCYTVSDNLSFTFNPNSAQILFADAPYNLIDIYKMYDDNDISSFELSTKLEFRGEYENRDFQGKNVVGILEGSDPNLKDSYIILSAHYDHLGIGTKINGDSIYNGLLDNAFGCAGILELARIYSEMETKPKRSIIFLFTTGEEKGLLGSIYYTDYPIKPIEKTIANINLDGLAFIDEFHSIISIGSGYSTLDDIVQSTALEAGLIVERFPEEYIEDDAFNRSDQVAFAKAGVPSCMIIDGTIYKNMTKEEGLAKLVNYFNNHYHSPSDDLQQQINYKAAEQHLEIIFNLTNTVANSETVPTWTNNSVFGVR